MSSVYPKAAPVAVVPPAFDEALCVERLVTLREARPTITRQLAAGKCISAVGGTVADVYRVWDEVEQERLACRAVSPADYSTVSAFKAALPVRNLDATLWYDGLKAEAGVSTWSDLVAATEPKEM